jgi:predicted ArsR family transcriptional regulator
MDEDTDSQLAGVGTLADPVRRVLYRYVVDHPHASRDGAAAATHVSRPLAAYHLDRLVDAGLLAVRYEDRGDRGGRAGRPAKLYERSSRRFDVQLPPRDDALVARVLARAVEASDPTDARAKVSRIAGALGAEIGIAGRGAETIDVLRTQGFEPIADSRGDVHLRNCPFHALVDEHRDLVCHMNVALVEGMLSGLEVGELHAVLDPAPNRCCVVLRRSER